jgi:hypothetical protein
MSDFEKDRIDHAYGIRGPYGNIWTPETFPTPEAAAAHVRAFWGDDQTKLRGFHIVPVEIRISDASDEHLRAIPVKELAR